MLELVNKKRNNLKKNKKGFTLVEVIVVLVILAILAAILVPAMIGWINKANKKTVVVEARNALLALQAIASDTYKPNVANSGDWTQADLMTAPDTDGKTTVTSKGEDLKTLTDDADIITKITALVVTSGKVKSFTFTSGDYSVAYTEESKFGDPVPKAKN